MVKTDMLTLRTILFPEKEVCSVQELYYRTAEGVASYSSPGGVLTVDGRAAFDTYFNVLPVVKYKEYCCLTSLFLKLRLSGSFVVQIFGVSHGEDGFTERCILRSDACSAVEKEFVFDISQALDGGCDNVYFTLTSEGGSFFGGSFEGECEYTHDVRLAVVICTFRREKYLLSNHRKICSYLYSGSNFTTDNIHFYIVDNGRTLNGSDIENEYVTLIPNKNTGGSGGFTRGYYEAVNSGRGYTHILFMDDDIILDCEMLLRVCALLRARKNGFEGLSAGGTMLRASDRITVHEAGSFWDGRRLNSIGNGCVVTDRTAVLEAAYYPKGNYHAWWFYCFPSDWQEKHGYPLQFFIKEDDIEYSLRCAEEIAVLIGIAVWHDDFDGKYDGFQEYYIKRNELIMTSVNDQKPYALFQVRKLILSVMKQTVYQRYFLADIIFRAYDDYLKGWEHFYNVDTAALNTELMSSCEPLVSDEELLEKYGVYFDEEKYLVSLSEPENNKKQALSLNGYLIPYVFYKKDRDGFAMTDLAKCRIVNFYRHRKVLHYDIQRKKGFVTVQKKRKLFANIFRLIFRSVKFLILYPSVRKGYRSHMKELSSKTE